MKHDVELPHMAPKSGLDIRSVEGSPFKNDQVSYVPDQPHISDNCKFPDILTLLTRLKLHSMNQEAVKICVVNMGNTKSMTDTRKQGSRKTTAE